MKYPSTCPICDDKLYLGGISHTQFKCDENHYFYYLHSEYKLMTEFFKYPDIALYKIHTKPDYFEYEIEINHQQFKLNSNKIILNPENYQLLTKQLSKYILFS